MGDWWSTLWAYDRHWTPWCVVIVVTLVAAVWDVWTHRIPNWLTGGCLLAGLVYASLQAGPRGAADAVAGAALALLPFLLLFAFAGGGAGDAKLMAAVGAWVGVIGGLVVVAMVLIAGGVLAVIHMLAMRRSSQVLANCYVALWRLRLAVAGRSVGEDALQLPQQVLHMMPYGPAIFVGTSIASGVVLRWHGTI